MVQGKDRNSIFKSGLKRRTLLMTGLLMLAVIIIQFLLAFTFLGRAFDQDITYVKQGFDTNIKTAVETVVSALEANHQLYLDGIIPEQTAMEIAKKIIRDTRYTSSTGKENDGYFWADTETGLCVVHYNSANEGAMRWNEQDQEGTYYIRELVAQGNAGGGYSDYYFGKPGDENGSYKKRGYTKIFEPYGWYISTGNYYEDTGEVIAEIDNIKRADLLWLLGASLFAVVIGLFLVSLNLNSVVTPIIKISDKVHKLSVGDISNDNLTVTSHDEIGDLHNSIIKVINILHELLDDINTMIDEHEKGNIDYSFDTGDFLGDYKKLADSVLELAAFGMKDQLTELPNRRSFDNRLDLEWNRAMRERSQISILMLDIDKFKRYNDSFGHQQGDVTLQVIAKTIKESLKRSVDFGARWGGEEFAVLLPNTNSTGAFLVAEKLRDAIEKTIIPCADARGTKATVSIGVNTLVPDPDNSIKNFISGADSALYKAKETGRNRVCIA